jgi:hypothetical protein
LEHYAIINVQETGNDEAAERDLKKETGPVSETVFEGKCSYAK